LPGPDKKITGYYGFKPTQAIGNTVEDIFKMIFNLKKREILENEKLEREFGTHISWQGTDGDSLVRKLKSAIMELDDTLLLFHEF
jgi:hypothetical protein